MKGIKIMSGWDELRDLGIIALTGEACSMSMRLLCDVTKRGEEFLCRFFGGNIEFKQGSNWNSSSGQTSSIMLPTAMLPELLAFAAHYVYGYKTIAKLEHGVVAAVNLDAFEEEVATWDQPQPWQEVVRMLTGKEVDRYYTVMDGSIGGRMQHQMTGRVE